MIGASAGGDAYDFVSFHKGVRLFVIKDEDTIVLSFLKTIYFVRDVILLIVEYSSIYDAVLPIIAEVVVFKKRR